MNTVFSRRFVALLDQKLLLQEEQMTSLPFSEILQFISYRIAIIQLKYYKFYSRHAYIVIIIIIYIYINIINEFFDYLLTSE